MAKVIPYIVEAAAAYFTWGASLISEVAAVAEFAASASLTLVAQRAAENAADGTTNPTDQLLTVRSGIATRQYIVGTRRTGGALLWDGLASKEAQGG